MDVEGAIELALSLCAEYAEVREERLLRTEIEGSGEVTVSSRYIGGFGVRVLVNGSWGFVSVNSPEDLKSLDELISDVERGFIALSLRGVNALDRATGDFSVVVTPALVIEWGEVRGFSSFELRGNVWELLRNATDVGKGLTRIWFDEGFSLSIPFLRTRVIV